MTDLLAARSQMAVSLAFHILFACAGMAMPLLMVLAEWRWQRTRDAGWLDLAKRWSHGVAILFAVGAVSGTVLSFELGLLWPGFMGRNGPMVGLPFALEGFAFFLEGIFIGIYLYGWQRVSERAHLLAGAVVLVSGTASGALVICANAWMNTPRGFVLNHGVPVLTDPIAALWTPAAGQEALHMTLAAFEAIGFAVAAIHAFMLLRNPGNTFHMRALRLSLVVGGLFALLQPISGDFSATQVARQQPLKLAAMEGQWETEVGAPLRIGGWPDAATETTRWAIEIPHGLSFLAFHDLDAKVVGLRSVPPADRPPAWPVHIAFQIMVAAGSALAGVALLGLWLRLRRRDPAQVRWYLWLVLLSGPLGLLAVEAGWTVTEVGRQPWTVVGLLRTADAVTPMPHLALPLLLFSLLYLALSAIVARLLLRHVFASPHEVDHA